jgi:predicted O-methyltransferase YrrM
LQSILHKGTLIPNYLAYRLTAKSLAGHGIHSPFVYNFTREVLQQASLVKIPEVVENIHKDLLESNKPLVIGNWGAGSQSLAENTTIGKLVKKSSVSPKLGRLLYKISQWAKPKYVIEIGTSVGISTLYLAAANTDSRIVTMEGNPTKVSIAREIFQKANLHNITIQEGDFDLSLEEALSQMPRIDLAFFDGNHKTEPTLRYFKKCSEFRSEKSIFIFDDIRWSKEMRSTWQIIRKHRSVSVSIDLFNVGIIFFRKGITKQHFAVNF